MKQSLIGVLILGSLFVQANRLPGKSFKIPSRTAVRQAPKMSDEALLIKYGYNKEYISLFSDALSVVWQRTDPELRTLEGNIIFDMTRYQRTQIILSEEWSKNGARENAIRFLVQFVNWAATLPLHTAFNQALLDTGLAALPNLETQKQKMLRHIETRTLFEFFGEKDAE